MTAPERILYELLAMVVGTKGFVRQPKVLGRHPDAAIPDLQIVFQADGDYWHGPNAPEGNRKADESFNRLFLLNGWDVVRIWEKTLKRQPDVAASLITQAVLAARASRA